MFKTLHCWFDAHFLKSLGTCPHKQFISCHIFCPQFCTFEESIVTVFLTGTEIFFYLTDSHFLCSSMNSRVKKTNSILKPAKQLQKKLRTSCNCGSLATNGRTCVTVHVWDLVSAVRMDVVSLRTFTLLLAGCCSLSAWPCEYFDTSREHLHHLIANTPSNSGFY